jgi:hypothetical protein
MQQAAALTEDSGLHLVKKPRKRSSKRPVTPPAPKPVPKSKTLAAVGGSMLGGFVPLAAHTLVNAPEFGATKHLLWIVVACLAYSAPTVCGWAGTFTTAGAKHWASHTLGWLKALGFVACLEGILVAAPASCAWLSWIALAMLMGINATILAVKFSKR